MASCKKNKCSQITINNVLKTSNISCRKKKIFPQRHITTVSSKNIAWTPLSQILENENDSAFSTMNHPYFTYTLHHSSLLHTHQYPVTIVFIPEICWILLHIYFINNATKKNLWQRYCLGGDMS